MTQQMNATLWQVGFMFVKWILIAIAVVLGVGCLAGIFTYGRPLRSPKKRKYQSEFESVLEDAWFLGMALTHRCIDWIRGVHSVNHGAQSWLSDQQIIGELRGLTPVEFEEAVAQLFSAMGYHTTVMGGKNDGGIDIEMWKKGRLSVVQCKKFITQKVTPHDVRDFFGAMGSLNADQGFFVTTGHFTYDAERFAEDKPIHCIDASQLASMMRKYGIVGGLQDVDEVCPKCGKPLVTRTNRKDESTFLGCSGYPHCRYTEPKKIGHATRA